MITIKNVDTGLIFRVEDEAGLEMLANFKGTLEAVDYSEDLKYAVEKIYKEPEMTTDEEKLLGVDKNIDNVKSLKDFTIPVLKSKLDELGIKYQNNAKKDDLIALLREKAEIVTDA